MSNYTAIFPRRQPLCAQAARGPTVLDQGSRSAGGVSQRVAATRSHNLAWVAEGVFDGFFELALGPWDVAAGGLLIQEAGGVVTDWGGGPAWMEGDIMAGPVAIHAELLSLAIR